MPHHPFVLMFIILKSGSVACRNAPRYSQKKCCFCVVIFGFVRGFVSSVTYLQALALVLLTPSANFYLRRHGNAPEWRKLMCIWIKKMTFL